MNHISDSARAIIMDGLRNNVGMREIQRRSGVHRDTIRRLRDSLSENTDGAGQARDKSMGM